MDLRTLNTWRAPLATRASLRSASSRFRRSRRPSPPPPERRAAAHASRSRGHNAWQSPRRLAHVTVSSPLGQGGAVWPTHRSMRRRSLLPRRWQLPATPAGNGLRVQVARPRGRHATATACGCRPLDLTPRLCACPSAGVVAPSICARQSRRPQGHRHLYLAPAAEPHARTLREISAARMARAAASRNQQPPLVAPPLATVLKAKRGA
mmetsp:Transcript_87952/g.247112  ORF Transcript_87952/g.247112 Transcript_87952/m.247112 type:complete len:208 (+) Transcript_87952:383-1006(+)